MKNSIACILALILLCLAQTSTAHQPETDFYPDSIRVELPEEKVLVIFEMRRFENDVKIVQSFPEKFQEWMSYVIKALPVNFRENGPRKITINLKPEEKELILNSGAGHFFKEKGEKAEITIQNLEPETNLVVRQNTIEQLLPPGWEVSILSKDVVVTIYASTFEGLEILTKQNFVQVESLLNSDPAMKYIGRKSIQARIILKDNKIIQHVIHYDQPVDMLGLDAHAAVGLYRERFYPELSFSASIYRNDRFNRTSQRFELKYSTMFFTEKNIEGGYTTNVNAFVSLSYGRNFSGSRNKWTSAGVGLLVHKSGDYFEGKTMKFFFSSDIGSSKINIMPEFYLTNDFRKFQYGLKLNYRF